MTDPTVSALVEGVCGDEMEMRRLLKERMVRCFAPVLDRATPKHAATTWIRQEPALQEPPDK